MRKIIFLIILFSLLLIPAFQAMAQSLSTTDSTQAVFDTTGFPQWAKDLRRGEIIAFGTFPFSLFFVTFTMDMIRWNNANGMDFSEQGRRYAPWPFKSAGGVDMSNDEFKRSLFLAAGLSISLALIDFLIVRARRDAEQRRIESLPSGSVEIERGFAETPPEVEEDPGGADSIEE